MPGRSASACRAVTPAWIVRPISISVLVSSALPRAASSSGFPHVGDAVQGGLCRLLDQADGLGRLLLARAHLVRVRRRAQRFCERAPGSLAVAPASRARTAGSSSSSRSCSRMQRVYDRVRRGCTRCGRRLTIGAMRYRTSLPQLQGTVLLCDGGMETTLVFGDGFELPCFASFPLLEHDEGRAAMKRYFEPYLEVARRHDTGFVLEANTWRANPAWGAQLGYSLDELAEANRRCVAFVEEIREREEQPGRPFVISAPIGPEGDAYDPASRMTAEEAEDVPLVAGRRSRRHGGGPRHGPHDHLRRGGDRDRPRGDGRRAARCRLLHGRDGWSAADRPGAR